MRKVSATPPNLATRPNREYYDEFADWYERERESGYHALVDQLEFELARRYGSGVDVLEVGCGTGLILRQLATIARRAYGVDLSRGMLAQAQRRNLCVAQGDISTLPFPSARFDLVCSFKVLAHVQAIAQALGELARVTRPGGHLLLEFYNAHSLRYLVRRLRPAARISARAREDEVFTRFDSLADVRGYLPPDVTIVGVRGVRVLLPLPHLVKLPILGPALGALETWAADAPALRHLGGFLIVIARKDR